jgi:hypothetical protein
MRGGDDRDLSVCNVLGTSTPAELTDRPRDRVEGGKNAKLQRGGKACLFRFTAPHLSECRARYQDVLAAECRKLQCSPHRFVVALESNERTGIEHDAHGRRGRRRRAAARRSALVIAPCSLSQSRTTLRSPWERSLRRAASASQVDVGSLPAARRTARASSGSNEIAKRATVILRYYYPEGSLASGHGCPSTRS